MLLWLYIFIIVICWALTPFFKKRLIKKVGSQNLLILNHFVITMLIIIYFAYLLKTKKCSVSCLKKLDKYDIGVLLLVSLGTVLSTVLLLEALNKSNISQLMPTITTLVIIFTLIISYYYGETINYYKLAGIFLIIAGIILLNFIN